MSEPQPHRWRVYIIGPDEYRPATSMADAMNVANEINVFLSTLPAVQRPAGTLVWAVPELHREDDE